MVPTICDWRRSSHLTRASVIPPGPVRMWMRGEWTDVLSMGYEITHEPEDFGVEEVNDLYIQALDALHADDGVMAESALPAALAMLPHNPRLRHNLGYALELQRRHAEARELLDANFALHPEYLFARLGVASYALLNDRIADAEELGRPLLTRTQFHFSEFEAFADFQVRLAIAKEQPDAAISWMSMWKTSCRKAPNCNPGKQLSNSLRTLSGLQSLQSRMRPPKKEDLIPSHLLPTIVGNTTYRFCSSRKGTTGKESRANYNSAITVSCAGTYVVPSPPDPTSRSCIRSAYCEQFLMR